MSYLVCNKCEGYYELQEGETQEDFDTCECGGTLKLTENIHMWIEEDNDSIYCSNCGQKNVANAIFCENCGNQIKNVNNDKETKTNSNRKTRKSVIHAIIYLAYFCIVLIFFLVNVTTILLSSIFVTFAFFSVVIILFLGLRKLLDKISK